MAKKTSLFNKIVLALFIGAGLYAVYYFMPETVNQWLNWADTTRTDPDTPQPQPDAPKPGADEPSSPADIRYADYLPTVSTGSQVVNKTFFSLAYANTHEQAEWVAYELTKKRVNGAQERSSNFRPDPAVRSGSAAPDDYKGSGYDRGHLAPAADMAFDATAMSESFFMSNMSPQEPGFNRGIWKELEEQVRDYAYQFGHLYVVTGPVLPRNVREKIGQANLVSVPKSYYKVILDVTGTDHKGLAFVLPNTDSDKPLEKFVVPIDEVERLTGLNFFPRMAKEDEQRLETRADIKQWGINAERAQKRIFEVQARLRSGKRLQAQY